MKTVIVTGAAGFMGINLVEALLKKNYFVYAILRPGSAHNRRLTEGKQLKKISIEMEHYDKLTDYIAEKCEAFFHLAWQGERDDFDVQKQNIDYAIMALEAAKGLSCKRFLCTGSQAEYGIQHQLITEETLPDPYTAYGAAKLAACYLTKRRAEQLGIDWLWGRIFSVYGKYEPQGRLIPDLVMALRQRKTFNLTSATQNWDYLYSEDAAEALIALVEQGRSGEIYNVANGDYHPLRYFTEQLHEQIAPKTVVQYGQKISKNEIVSLQPSVKKIFDDTGWEPKTSFMDGILLI